MITDKYLKYFKYLNELITPLEKSRQQLHILSTINGIISDILDGSYITELDVDLLNCESIDVPNKIKKYLSIDVIDKDTFFRKLKIDNIITDEI